MLLDNQEKSVLPVPRSLGGFGMGKTLGRVLNDVFVVVMLKVSTTTSIVEHASDCEKRE
jgi:hypothetical protein